MMLGAGATSCGHYLSEAPDLGHNSLYTQWSLGFLTRFNFEVEGGDILTLTDIDGMEGEVANYCRKYPTDTFGVAGMLSP